MVAGGSQWLGHHDLEAIHQQQFQEPKTFFILSYISIYILEIKKKIITLFKRFVLVVMAVASPECLTSNTISLT